jgi:hypothetical protein
MGVGILSWIFMKKHVLGVVYLGHTSKILFDKSPVWVGIPAVLSPQRSSANLCLQRENTGFETLISPNTDFFVPDIGRDKCGK